ncbi:hypothetical protein RA307_04955 [Xanthobacteraceae bacterium Astr-EGSB]|uniref:hypothetical protein n=1 Tax=Astrobacterium formosum TaxID=3069710 RepID=UPI0027B277E5|nr:hypothetical protein [Xanthobacteraceae bacterium Astr-EGSB]
MRISPIAPPGSLLKVAPREHATKPARRPKSTKGRDLDAKHLALVRRCPCLSCDADPAGEAAHVRMSGPDKPMPGAGAKPSDRFALPICPACHTRGARAQHRVGEARFWRGLGLDPLLICAELYAASPDIEAMRAVVFKHREGRSP